MPIEFEGTRMLHRRKEPMSSVIRAHSEVVRRMELGAGGAVFLEVEAEPLAATANRVVTRQIENGASLYQRERDLPKLFPSWNLEALSDGEIVARLGKAVGAGMNALASNHWTADIHRLAALRMALKAESERDD